MFNLPPGPGTALYQHFQSWYSIQTCQLLPSQSRHISHGHCVPVEYYQASGPCRERKRASALWFRQLSPNIPILLIYRGINIHKAPFPSAAHTQNDISQKKIVSFMNWLHYMSGMIINPLDTTEWITVQPFINTIEIANCVVSCPWMVQYKDNVQGWSEPLGAWWSLRTNHSNYMPPHFLL